MSETTDRLYRELPALYRRGDAEHGEVLRALMAVLQEPLEALEEDVAQLYRDWFIETCDEWVVPYIGDLLGVAGLRQTRFGAFSLRAYVANTLRYRRRKGTAAVLEDLARDVTGWPARAVEFFERLDTTQNDDHVRSNRPRTTRIDRPRAMALLGGPFGDEVHTAEVRDITRGGRFNIPNLGLFLWRLREYQVEGVTARRVGRVGARVRYTFDPLGLDAPLFNHPRTERDVEHLAEPIDVPGPLTQAMLCEALSEPSGEVGQHVLGAQPVLGVAIDGAPLPPEHWRAFQRWERHDPATEEALNDWIHIAATPGGVAIDPARGRLVLQLDDPTALEPTEVTVRYSYGFSADLGAGPYDRSARVALPESVDWQAAVGRSLPAGPSVHATVGGAVADWIATAQARWTTSGVGTIGVLALADSRTYVEDVDIELPPHSALTIVAATWPAGHLADLRPHLRGQLRVRAASAPGVPESRPTLAVDGLLLEGDLQVQPGDLGTLELSHATLVPDHRLTVAPATAAHPTTTGNIGLQIRLERAITGAIALPETVPGLELGDSIVDGAGDTAIDAPGAEVRLVRATVFGPVGAGILHATDTLFDGEVQVRRRQTGCVRYSFVPHGSETPRRYRCQPSLALSRAPLAEHDRIVRRLRPVFLTRAFGDPRYAQLARIGPDELVRGSEDGGEMGAFGHLENPRREANLRAAVDQYLRGGLRAGFIFET